MEHEILDGVASRNLKTATTTLVLGIISILAIFLYFLPGLILATVTLAISAKDRKAVRLDPTRFDGDEIRKLKAGRICAIVALVLQVLMIIVVAIFFVIDF